MSEPTDAAAQVGADPQTDPAATEDTSGSTEAASGHDSGQSEDTATSPNSEAAKYRTRLREVETERDVLLERLAGYQRREVETVAAEVLDVPGDLFDVGNVELAGLYGEDGQLNRDAVLAAAAALADQRPRLAKPPAKPPNMGQHGTHYFGEQDSAGAWSTVIKSRR